MCSTPPTLETSLSGSPACSARRTGQPAAAPAYVGRTRPRIVLFGDSLTERGFEVPSGWASALAHNYTRKVQDEKPLHFRSTSPRHKAPSAPTPGANGFGSIANEPAAAPLQRLSLVPALPLPLRLT